MVLLQAAMGLAFAFIVTLFIGAIICVPTLVYCLKRRNKQFESYTGIQKFCFVAIATIVSFMLVINVVWFLFSLMDISST